MSIERFSEDEAPTVAMRDRPTPDFQTPARLLHFAEAALPSQAEAPISGDRIHVADSVPVGAADENEFWDSEPRYSTTSVRPAAPSSLLPAPPSSRQRSPLAKVLFAALFSVVLALLCYEGSVLLGAI